MRSSDVYPDDRYERHPDVTLSGIRGAPPMAPRGSLLESLSEEEAKRVVAAVASPVELRPARS